LRFGLDFVVVCFGADADDSVLRLSAPDSAKVGQGRLVESVMAATMIENQLLAFSALAAQTYFTSFAADVTSVDWAGLIKKLVDNVWADASKWNGQQVRSVPLSSHLSPMCNSFSLAFAL
jgi:hypothetical protein